MSKVVYALLLWITSKVMGAYGQTKTCVFRLAKCFGEEAKRLRVNVSSEMRDYAERANIFEFGVKRV